MKQKIIYLLRWWLSAAVMMPLMIWLEKLGYSLWLNLFIGQTFGALVFWNIDKFIFTKIKE